MQPDPLAPCPSCGHYQDTPNHEHGCPIGRLHARVDRALSVLAKIDRLGDCGHHAPDCWRTFHHRDCLAELIESILRGETRDAA